MYNLYFNQIKTNLKYKLQDQFTKMQAQKAMKKPNLPLGNSKKIVDSLEQKIFKLQIFYRYRLPSIYRQLKRPLYDKLLKDPRTTNNNNNRNTQNKSNNTQKINTLEQNIQILYKKVMLNSKYHHRQKMRFSRTPLLKFIKYNFHELEEKLKLKNYLSVYDDLEDEDDEDQGKDDKKQYAVDPHFSAQALARYKKKNEINGRIVSALGYDDIKARLIQKYGWTQNPDTTSLMYDYKHMSKKKDIDYVNILQDQVVNHFHQNKSVTAKFGLTRNIRNICSMGKDPSHFFPRCYDVNDVTELQNFYESFKETYVQSILKKYVNSKGLVPSVIQMGQYQKLITMCIQIVQRYFIKIQKKIQLIDKDVNISITQQEFQMLLKYQSIMGGKVQYTQNGLNQKLFEKAVQLCKYGENVDPQWDINKDNIWIVKPASMSRGRGIKTFNNINEILDYVIGKDISWVVQKYIENPLIIKKRKFDIRQWVLLTDFKPFRVWKYEECYIRFCATLYTPQNLKDRKIHLTNNSVTKGISDITNDGIYENMVSQKQFSVLLKQKEGKDIFNELIKPQIKKIAVQTLQSVKQNMVSRKNTFQVFGFDFMIDENYKVWLIEVNSSPTMQYSTKVTTQIVKKGMGQLGDLINNYMFKGKFYDKNRAQQLYGGWNLLSGF